MARKPVVPTAGDGDCGFGLAREETPPWTPSGDADCYRGYQTATIVDHVGASLFEVGAQTGEVSERLVERLGHKIQRLVLSDRDPGWVRHLENRFRPSEKQLAPAEVLHLDLPDEFDIDPVDTVLLVNVLGHIDDDVAAIKALTRVTASGGRLIVWEAGYPKLLSQFDLVRAGRKRRYTPEDLTKVLERAGLDVEICRPVNILGGLFNRVMVSRTNDLADPRLVRLYDRLVVPLSRRLDRLHLPFGQNVFAVARVR